MVDLIASIGPAAEYRSRDAGAGYEAETICGMMDVMDDSEEYRLPPGRQPYDVLNGLRIGALVGGILAAIVMVLTSFDSLWVLLVGAVIGGVIGYLYERRRLTAARTAPPQS